MRLFKTIIYVSALLAVLRGLAEPADGAGAPAPLTMEAARRESRDRHPAMRAARESIEQARAELRAGYAPFMPRLSFQGDASRSATDRDDGWTESTGYGASLTARQSVFTGFRDQSRLTQAQAMLASAELDLQIAEADIGQNLSGAFTRLLYARDFMVMAGAIAERRAENLKLVELRFEAGREHQGSYLRIRAYHTQALFDVAQARRAIDTARRNLATALGRNSTNQLDITGDWRHTAPTTLPDFSIMARATPEYLQADTRRQAADAAVRIADSGYYPDISAGGSFGRDGDTWPPDDERWSLNISLSWPLFEGGAVRQAVRKAAAARRQIEAQMAQTENTRTALLEERFHAWQDAAGRIAVLTEFQHAAEVRAQIARSQYANGLISFDDWDLIENDLIDKEKNMLAGRRDVILAQAAWERATGRPAADEQPTANHEP